jgi:hypothetical protein
MTPWTRFPVMQVGVSAVIQRSHGKQIRLDVLGCHNRSEFGDQLGVLASHVALLTGVRRQIVEFDGAGFLVFRLWARIQVASQRFPITRADTLLTTVPRRLPIEERAWLLCLAQQCRSEANAVQIFWCLPLGAAKFEQRRQPVLESGDAVAAGARRDVSLPAN